MVMGKRSTAAVEQSIKWRIIEALDTGNGAGTVTLTRYALPNVREERLGHLTLDEQTALAVLVAHLRQRYGDDLLRVTLYGSKSRGDFDAESDLDVLVVVRAQDYWGCWREITDLTSQLLLETGVNISALVRDETRYQWWKTHHAPIYNSIRRDGVDLFPSFSPFP